MNKCRADVDVGVATAACRVALLRAVWPLRGVSAGGASCGRVGRVALYSLSTGPTLGLARAWRTCVSRALSLASRLCPVCTGAAGPVQLSLRTQPVGRRARAPRASLRACTMLIYHYSACLTLLATRPKCRLLLTDRGDFNDTSALLCRVQYTVTDRSVDARTDQLLRGDAAYSMYGSAV